MGDITHITAPVNASDVIASRMGKPRSGRNAYRRPFNPNNIGYVTTQFDIAIFHFGPDSLLGTETFATGASMISSSRKEFRLNVASSSSRWGDFCQAASWCLSANSEIKILRPPAC
ncbi:hypothetical protein HFO58_34710 [Rhizobium leguminosarum]|uniref:hypothetical protein n=1 Tax=Rhizobium leguminosarum TaxID=384 RepID=UPI001C964655|nr:hypothetical protein [Rhizobium leguminosarum]MBY5538227.1 hypothetical protein [Rhizobium leguminosarum]